MTPIKICLKNLPAMRKAAQEIPAASPDAADLVFKIANLAECKLIALTLPNRKRAGAQVYGRDRALLFRMERRSRSWFLTDLREAPNQTGEGVWHLAVTAAQDAFAVAALRADYTILP